MVALTQGTSPICSHSDRWGLADGYLGRSFLGGGLCRVLPAFAQPTGQRLSLPGVQADLVKLGRGIGVRQFVGIRRGWAPQGREDAFPAFGVLFPLG